jgi:glycosyltransferase involved in cell wall biosynthesis
MKILHVTPHLGGGVGKAHAALSAVFPDIVEQTFVLLESPRDRRFITAIEAAGARVVVAGGLGDVGALSREADIVQFEFWNHPRLFECLACCEFPPMRSAFWSHISGLFRPLIPPGLVREAGRFVFSTEASLSIPTVAALREAEPRKIAVINSGFGFANAPQRNTKPAKPAIAYLGTVDFVKMHPGFFDLIDQLGGGDVRVSVWGAADGAVVARAAEMQHPERICFCGETVDPAAALREAAIFFYPLQADHYGTSENALIEAMSLGLVPVVLNNPAERGIIRNGETGFVAHSIAECVSLLQMLLSSPEVRERVSGNAIRYVEENLTPDRSALEFMILWLGLLSEPARQCNFRAVVGESPADWFLATQCLPGSAWVPPTWQANEHAAKGTLAHFESLFAGDSSFARLRQSFADGRPHIAPVPKRASA